MMSLKPGNEFAVLLFQNVKQVIDFSTYLLGYKINSFVYNLPIFDTCLWSLPYRSRRWQQALGVQRLAYIIAYHSIDRAQTPRLLYLYCDSI